MEMPDQISITSLGLVSSLGGDALNSCAAARAGVSRAQELPTVRFKSLETGEMECPVVHSVPYGVDGFEGQARIFVLLKMALSDLLKRMPFEFDSKKQIGFYLVLPQEEETSIDAFKDLIPNASVHDQFYGHCGGSLALQKAKRDLEKKKIDFAFVGAADSLVDESALQNLIETRRLKRDGMPVGLQPGEAGVFFLLERSDFAIERGASIWGAFDDAHIAQEEATLLSGEPGLGVGLSLCLAEGLKDEKESSLWFLTDQNGEEYRALEWGYALTRLVSQFPRLEDSLLWYPAMSFGDTGAAGSFVAMSLVLCAFQRNYAPSSTALILSSSVEKERSTIVLRKKENRKEGVSYVER